MTDKDYELKLKEFDLKLQEFDQRGKHWGYQRLVWAVMATIAICAVFVKVFVIK